MLKIRLRRTGGTNAPAYRIVVSDSRRTPTAKVIEELGHYDPTKNPPLIDFDTEKAKAWIAKGATASETAPKPAARPKAWRVAATCPRRTSSSSGASRVPTAFAAR